MEHHQSLEELSLTLYSFTYQDCPTLLWNVISQHLLQICHQGWLVIFRKLPESIHTRINPILCVCVCASLLDCSAEDIGLSLVPEYHIISLH